MGESTRYIKCSLNWLVSESARYIKCSQNWLIPAKHHQTVVFFLSISCCYSSDCPSCSYGQLSLYSYPKGMTLMTPIKMPTQYVTDLCFFLKILILKGKKSSKGRECCKEIYYSSYSSLVAMSSNSGGRVASLLDWHLQDQPKHSPLPNLTEVCWNIN